MPKFHYADFVADNVCDKVAPTESALSQTNLGYLKVGNSSVPRIPVSLFASATFTIRGEVSVIVCVMEFGLTLHERCAKMREKIFCRTHR